MSKNSISKIETKWKDQCSPPMSWDHMTHVQAARSHAKFCNASGTVLTRFVGSETWFEVEVTREINYRAKPLRND